LKILNRHVPFREGETEMTTIRVKSIALSLVAAISLAAFNPGSRGKAEAATGHPAWQLGLVAGIMTSFIAYIFWSVAHEGEVSQREFDRERRERYLRDHRELPLEKAEAIREGKLVKFMTEEEVWASWGRPDDRLVHESGAGNLVQWVWRKGEKKIWHAVFENGLLMRWYVEVVEE